MATQYEYFKNPFVFLHKELCLQTF